MVIKKIRLWKEPNGIMSCAIDGVPLEPKASQVLYNHSPDGFGWGYCGSGPAQLALALCLHYLQDRQLAMEVHQQFKEELVATWGSDHMGIYIKEVEVLGWFYERNLLYHCTCGFRGCPVDFTAHRERCHYPLWDGDRGEV